MIRDPKYSSITEGIAGQPRIKFGASVAYRNDENDAHPNFYQSSAHVPANPYPYAHILDVPSKISISELKRLFTLETTPDSDSLYENRYPVFDMPGFIKEEQGITPLRMGTLLHTMAENINLTTDRTIDLIEQLILNLRNRNLITQEEAAAVDREKILRFVNSPLADRMRASPRIFREVPFVLALSPQEIDPKREFGVPFSSALIPREIDPSRDTETPISTTHSPREIDPSRDTETPISTTHSPLENDPHRDTDAETILVHGIIDCYFEENDAIILVDYKNDAVRDNPVEWAKNHKVQMNIYKRAVEQATQKKVSETLLYSFSLNDTVGIT